MYVGVVAYDALASSIVHGIHNGCVCDKFAPYSDISPFSHDRLIFSGSSTLFSYLPSSVHAEIPKLCETEFPQFIVVFLSTRRI